MLDEHKEKTHGFFIYQGNIKVPLIFKLPGKQKPRIVNDIAGIVDITPTICSLLGIDIPQNVQGMDLSGYLGNNATAETEKRYLYSESMTPTKYAGNSLLGIVGDNYKYIQTTRPELYDLINDPKESDNLITQQQGRARILQDKLKQILEESVLENTESDLELDAEALAKLETLGYVGGGIEEDFSFDQEKTDPKDLIEYHVDISRIQGLIQAEQFDTAQNLCEELLAKNITETYGQLCHFMVFIAKKKNDHQMARTYIQEIIKLDPDQPSPYIEYGGILLKLGESSQAAAQFVKADELRPDNAVITGNIAKAYYDSGNLNKAIEFCYKALELKPDYLLVRISLADTLMKNNQLELAVKQYYEVLRLEPDNIEALNTLAWIQATSKDKDLSNPKEALRLALHACKIDDYQKPGLLDTLAAAYASNLQFAEAAKMAAKAVQMAKEQGLDERASQMTVRLRHYQAAQRK
jgi:tetratricopeptide (TPR) repeat protein